MKRVVAGVVVILLALVVAPANAQPVDSPRLSPREPQPSESDGKVVLTLSKQTPGRIMYRTVDGRCTNPFTGLERSPCSPHAQAPEDYGAVSGEVVFTRAGSRKITIPIVDDDLAEGMEAFQVEAHEVEDTSGWAGGDEVVVRIVDDEDPDCAPLFQPCSSDDAGGPAAATTTTTPRRRPASGAPVPTLPSVRSRVPGVPAPPTTTASRQPDLEVALASGELRPGPGFELTSDGAPEPAPGRGGGSGGSAVWVALGLGSAAVGVGGVIWVRRRRQWSPTRA